MIVVNAAKERIRFQIGLNRRRNIDIAVGWQLPCSQPALANIKFISEPIGQTIFEWRPAMLMIRQSRAIGTDMLRKSNLRQARRQPKFP